MEHFKTYKMEQINKSSLFLWMNVMSHLLQRGILKIWNEVGKLMIWWDMTLGNFHLKDSSEKDKKFNEIQATSIDYIKGSI